jgi:DNA-binding HxlR family transcriptional regulator
MQLPERISKAHQPPINSTHDARPARITDTPTLLPPGGTNAIGNMLGLLGDEWNLFIIGHALMGTTRYAQFMAQIPISNWVLSNRLEILVNNGLLMRREHPASRTRSEYLPTPRSRPLWPLMLSMWAWERRWVAGSGENLPQMRHVNCHRPFLPLLTCGNCGAEVVDDEVMLELGPSGAWQRSTPTASTRRRADHNPDLYPEVMQVVGNRWAAALLVAAFLGTKRFNEFRAVLGVPPGSLAERLQTFCEIGVLRTANDDEDGAPRGAYQLTDKGRALFPVLAGVLTWSERWFQAPEGPAITLTHEICGASFEMQLACNRCLERLSGDDIEPVGCRTKHSAPQSN